MKNSIRTFVKSLEEREFSKTTRQKFWDFCELAYCALAKQATYGDEAEALEERYMQIVGTYRDKDAVRAYPELLALVYHEVMAGRDLLGPVAAELGVLDNAQGQFFTPYEVCTLMARQLFGNGVPEIDSNGFVTVDEPASGAGAMILAVAQMLREGGYDPTTQLVVRATDLSQLCYWMSYIQLAMAGIPALVVHGNSLSLEVFSEAATRPLLAAVAKHGNPFKAKAESSQAVIEPVVMQQLALF